MKQFREGNIFPLLLTLVVLETLGAKFESDDEFIEYFVPVDSDGVNFYLNLIIGN